MSRDRLNEELLRLRAEQKWTAVFVTHSVAEAVFLSTRVVVMAARPGRIVAQVDIDEPFPRGDDYRLKPAFAERCVQLSRMVADASGAAGASQ